MNPEERRDHLRMSRARAAPAVAVTAFVRPEDEQRAEQAGLEEHLGKPCELPHLLAAGAHLAGKTAH